MRHKTFREQRKEEIEIYFCDTDCDLLLGTKCHKFTETRCLIYIGYTFIDLCIFVIIYIGRIPSVKSMFRETSLEKSISSPLVLSDWGPVYPSGNDTVFLWNAYIHTELSSANNNSFSNLPCDDPHEAGWRLGQELAIILEIKGESERHKSLILKKETPWDLTWLRRY